MSWALAQHPAYWTSVETHFFYYLLRDDWLASVHTNSAGAGSWLDVHAISTDDFFAHAGLGFNRLMRSRSDGRHWVDGSPENLLVGRPLLRMFRQAHMIHVVRDPEAVCRSMLTSGFDEPWARDIDAAIQVWKHYVSAGLDLAGEFPDRVTRIRQEDMRTSPAAVAGAIGPRLNLDDAAPIGAFLARETINSSADKSTYVDFSPFRDAAASVPDSAAFRDLFGDRIWENTETLAARCGYTREPRVAAAGKGDKTGTADQDEARPPEETDNPYGEW